MKKLKDKLKAVILCGGMGTRLRDYADPVPKALVRIGEMPIIWHVMKIYSHYGINDFVLCLGFKGDQIKKYFLDFELLSNDFTLNLGSKDSRIINHNPELETWNITFADTGLKSGTGMRLKLAEKYLGQSDFFCTYTDGLADIRIDELYKFHKKTGRIGTVTTVHPFSMLGVISEKDNLVTSFREKPQLEDRVNGGFFVFKQDIFDYVRGDEMLEEAPLRRLTSNRQLANYHHDGFWACMDTFKDVERLNSMYTKNNAPWMIWKK
jgi:glucose-1-phosphate cytidylyltransferase